MYRVKGFVRFEVDGHPECYALNTVGKHIRMTPHNDSTGASGTQIVLIGTRIDDEFLEVRLLDCVRRPGDATDASAMLPVHRYVTSDGS